MFTKLFIGNLSFHAREIDLHQAFGSHGTVVRASLMMDPKTGASRGLAFVTMSSSRDARNAVTALNGKSLNGSRLAVSIAVDQAPQRNRHQGQTGMPDSQAPFPLK